MHHFRDESHDVERGDIYPFPVQETHNRTGDQPFTRVQDRFDGSELRTRASRLGGYASGNVYLGGVSIHPGIRYENYSRCGDHSLMTRLTASWKGASLLSVSAGYCA